VTDIFVADTKLNISPCYLRPGGPYGGSCLPKDLSAMMALARDHGLIVPVLRGISESNSVHLAWLVNAVRNQVRPNGLILLLGLAFKNGTDDLRDSPLVDLAEKLLDAEYDLGIYDPDINPCRLLGANFAIAAEHRDTLLDRLVTDVEAIASNAELIIVGKAIPGIEARLPAGKRVLDITRLSGF
jgi:GDP-mannose 6-dehydrogenase